MREWADLGEELLDLILSKLFDKDRYNFRLVCRSWNAAAASSPYPNSPCLLYYDRIKHLWGFFQYKSCFFRSFPEFDNAEILCSKYGWLLMSRDDRTLFFFDPFNENTLELYLTSDNAYTSTHFFHPPTSPECLIVGIASPLGSDGVTIGLLRYGEDEWVSHTYESEYETLTSISAPVLHHGLLYFVDMEGDVATLDMSGMKDDVETFDKKQPSGWVVYTKCLKFRRLRSKIRRHYLFKIKGEEALYAVFLIHDNLLVNVFRLSEPDMKWELVKDLGDKMLYLSHTSSFGDTANPKSMANTICFPTVHGDNLFFYSLNTRKYHSFEGHYSYNNSSNLTTFNYGAAWIRPIHTPQLSTDFTWYSEDDSEECGSDSEECGSDSEEYDPEEYDSEVDVSKVDVNST